MWKPLVGIAVLIALASPRFSESPSTTDQDAAVRDIHSANGRVFLKDGTELKRTQSLDEFQPGNTVVRLSVIASDDVLKRLPLFLELEQVELLGKGLAINEWKELAKCRKLRVVRLGHLDPRLEEAFEAIGQLPEVTEIETWNCDLSAACYRHLKGSKKLERLRVSDTKRPVNDEAIEYLGHVTSLLHLSVSFKDVTSQGMPHFGRLTNLRHLNLDCVKIKDDDLRPLAGLKNVNWLSFRGVPLTGRGLDHLTTCSSLSVIKFEKCENLEDEIWTSLAKLRGMNVIEIVGPSPQITGRGIESLSELSQLENLHIRNTSLTDESFARFPALPRLHFLSLRDNPHLTGRTLSVLGETPPLYSLNLGGTGVTDEGLAELTKIKVRASGFSLDLEDCQVSESAIAKLAGSTIKTIRLPKSLKPTDAGVKRFLEAPGTSVLAINGRYDRNGLVISKSRSDGGPKSGK